MQAELLRDPNFQVQIANSEAAANYGSYHLIIDRAGHWCDIPCATDATSLTTLVREYFLPRLEPELARLRQFQQLSHFSGQSAEDVVGVGLFYYEPPGNGHIPPPG